MRGVIKKDKLYGDESNAFVLCEYPRELILIKQFINTVEKRVEEQKIESIWSFEGVCYSFAKTIVDYSKMAYDNLILGHFHAVNMINRAILENCVSLEIIVNNNEYELWKYYIVYSYRNAVYKSNKQPSQEQINDLNNIYMRYEISEDFYVKQPGENKAYICKPYGWTYKVNKEFSNVGVCKLVGEGERIGFKLMSEYSHGTAFYLKVESSVFIGNMMSMFISIYIELYKMVQLLEYDMIDDNFDKIADELEGIFHRYIQYEEEHFTNYSEE